MKKLMLLLAILALAASAQAQISIQWGTGSDDPSDTYVYPYINSNGRVVPGYYQTGPDQANYYTWPTNQNPYGGATGRHGRHFYYSD